MNCEVLVREATSTQLFERFNKDIIYDAHSLTARVSRSEAAREIRRRGKAVLSDLGALLRNYTPSSSFPAVNLEVKVAWGVLLSWLGEEQRLSSTPLTQSDYEGWVIWCLTHSRNQADGFCFKPGCCKEVSSERQNRFYCSNECTQWAWRENHPNQPEPDWVNLPRRVSELPRERIY